MARLPQEAIEHHLPLLFFDRSKKTEEQPGSWQIRNRSHRPSSSARNAAPRIRPIAPRTPPASTWIASPSAHPKQTRTPVCSAARFSNAVASVVTRLAHVLAHLGGQGVADAERPRQVLILDVLLGSEEVSRPEPPSEALEARRQPVGFPALVIVEGEEATHELEVVGGGARPILLVDRLGNETCLHRDTGYRTETVEYP